MARRAVIAISCIALGALAAVPSASANSAQPKAQAGAGGLVGTLAASACGEERQAIGRKSFRKRYGKKHTMRSCVKRTRSRARDAVSSAAADCQTEMQDWGTEEFFADWDSFSDCVADYASWYMDGGDENDDMNDDDEDLEDEGDGSEDFRAVR